MFGWFDSKDNQARTKRGVSLGILTTALAWLTADPQGQQVGRLLSESVPWMPAVLGFLGYYVGQQHVGESNPKPPAS